MLRILLACCLVVLCIVPSCAYSQQSNTKTLLWRISGKGLQQPSYLYGTIHLTDKRLFNLGDSVYRAIEKVEGLAIELSPDELGAYYINKAMEGAEGEKLQDLLNEKDYKKYSAALAKKFKKPAAKITTGDIVAAKNKWLTDYLEKGEMATFLDAYLYNIARRQGKWVGGVEDMADQAGLMEDLVDKSDIDMLLASDTSVTKKAANNMMENMVEMYCNQDLAGIEAMTGSSSPEFKDLLLIKRNVKMARRIDSLTALRTMFIAVGAAHLPGDSGVIHLLRSRGFRVEPVISSKKINAADYTFKEVKLPWIESEDKQGLYKVSTPGNAIDIKLYGLIEMKFMFDIFTLSNYCTMSVPGPRSLGNKDSILQELAQRMFQTTEKLTAKNVTISGIEGREYIHTIMGQKMRMQAFIHENVLYVAFMNALKPEMLSSADADRFFGSFTITKKQLTANEHLFVDSVMGISLISPAELTYNKQLSINRDGWHISAFAGADLTGGSFVMLFSKEVFPGLYLMNDTTIQNRLVQNMKAQYTNIHIDSINVQGYNGIALKGAHIQQKGFYMQGISLIKNNRNIVLLAINDSAKMQSPEIQKIFSSLRFIAPPAIPWNIYTTTDSLFSARVPGAFRNHNSAGNNYLYSYDTTTASSYYIRRDTLSKYTWYKNDSSFWANTASRYQHRGDSLIQKSNIVLNGEPALELLVKEAVKYKRMRFYQHDDQIVQVSVLGDSNFVVNSSANEFFNSFRINVPQQNKHFMTQSKAALLLQDLASADSATREQAVDALTKVQFEKTDAPLLQEALLKKYISRFSYAKYSFTNYRLAAMLVNLNDSTTVSFIKEKYPSLTGENEDLRNPALATLAGLHSRESYTTLGQLIEQYGAPKEAMDVQCIHALKDSLALTATLFNTLQKLAKDSAHSCRIAEIFKKLSDSGFIKKEQLAPLQTDFIEAAKKVLAAVKKEEVEFYIVDDLLQLIGGFNTTAGNAVLKSYVAVKNLYIKKEAVIQLTRNKQAVAATELLKLAADADIRPQFYAGLKDLKKTALFPQQYATQQFFGESAVNAIAGDDYEVKKITFLAKRTASYKGKPYTFYLYRVVLEDDEPAGYLGIAGGYKPGSASLETDIDLNGVHWDETYSAGKVDAHFKTYLKSQEKASWRE
ncbi:hypothetical protein A3860_33375 [Niastella vici]|uniref:TraB/GumN family protein n=1 Tax=Niastella vici TaxID=1703345 RepID=A0A1V9FQ27_9BACT|nr:TraB/GumN family protein [Niastella vici]OQP60479.1 hypothetical protein A3860_33375 [Niastella vici]